MAGSGAGAALSADLGENLELGLLPSPSSWLPFSAEPRRHLSPEIYSSVRFRGDRRALFPQSVSLPGPASEILTMKAVPWGPAGDVGRHYTSQEDRIQFAYDIHHLEGGRGPRGSVILTVGGKESKTKQCLKQETRN